MFEGRQVVGGVDCVKVGACKIHCREAEKEAPWQWAPNQRPNPIFDVARLGRPKPNM